MMRTCVTHEPARKTRSGYFLPGLGFAEAVPPSPAGRSEPGGVGVAPVVGAPPLPLFMLPFFLSMSGLADCEPVSPFLPISAWRRLSERVRGGCSNGSAPPPGPEASSSMFCLEV
jgi:hypothetical protein